MTEPEGSAAGTKIVESPSERGERVRAGETVEIVPQPTDEPATHPMQAVVLVAGPPPPEPDSLLVAPRWGWSPSRRRATTIETWPYAGPPSSSTAAPPTSPPAQGGQPRKPATPIGESARPRWCCGRSGLTATSRVDDPGRRSGRRSGPSCACPHVPHDHADVLLPLVRPVGGSRGSSPSAGRELAWCQPLACHRFATTPATS